MDISDLLDGDLSSALQGLGLSDTNVSDLGKEIGGQLLGGDGFDLSDLLTGLDADAFLANLNVAELAEAVGISPQLVSGALALIMAVNLVDMIRSLALGMSRFPFIARS